MRSLEKLKANARSFVSRKTLDIVEPLPEFQGGRLQTIQMIRQRQREAAGELQTSSRPPEGISVDLTEIHLLAWFGVEEFEHVNRSIRKRIAVDWRTADISDRIANASWALDGSSFIRLGMFAPANSSIRRSDATISNEISDQISWIRIDHCRLLPSFAFLHFRIRVADEFRSLLQRIASGYHLPEVESHSVMPHRLFSGFTESGRDQGREKVMACCANICGATEAWARKYFSLRRGQLQFSVAHPVYRICGLPTPYSCDKWAANNHSALERYGYSRVPFLNYGTTDRVVSRSSARYWPENFRISIEPVFIADKEADASDFNFSGAWSNLLAASCVTAISSSNRFECEKIRRRTVLLAGGRKLLGGRHAKHCTALNHALLRSSRFLSEFDKSRGTVERYISAFGKLVADGLSSDRVFSNVVVSNASQSAASTHDELNMLNNAWSLRLSMENIYTMYRLQTWVFALTLLALCLSIAQLSDHYQDIWEFIQNVWPF